MIYFVDTGVLLRALDRSDTNFHQIRLALKSLRDRGDSLETTPQNFREFWNVSTRPASSRGGYGRSIHQTARRIRVLETILTVVPESLASFERWKDLVETHAVVGVQVHDANLVAIMAIRGATRLLTLNPSDFRRYPSIEAVTPADVLASI